MHLAGKHVIIYLDHVTDHTMGIEGLAFTDWNFGNNVFTMLMGDGNLQYIQGYLITRIAINEKPNER